MNYISKRFKCSCQLHACCDSLTNTVKSHLLTEIKYQMPSNITEHNYSQWFLSKNTSVLQMKLTAKEKPRNLYF